MKIKLILLTMLLSTSMLHAQQQEPVSVAGEKLILSLADAQQYAVEQNKSLQNASIEVQKAHAARWQAIAAMLPQVDASGMYTNMFGYEMAMNMGGGSNQMMGILGNLMNQHWPTAGDSLIALSEKPQESKIKMDPYMTVGLSASIGLNGQAIVGALLSELAIEMQDISYAQSEENLRASVMTSYLSILAMEDIVGLLDSSLVNIENLAAMTQKAVEVGAQEQTAADQILVRVNTLKNNINSNRRNVELAYNSLRILLGVEAGREIELTQTLDELLSAEAILQLLGEDFVLTNNHNYQLLQKNTELAKKNETMAWMAYTPTIGLSYQYQYRHTWGGGFNMTPPNLVAVSVSVPIWSSGKRAAAVTEKKLAYEAAVNTLEETTDQLGIQYQQLRFNLSNAYETYANEKENIDVTQRVFTSTTNKYEQGVASNLELTNASNDLITAQSTYVQAVLTLVNAQVELAKFLNNK